MAQYYGGIDLGKRKSHIKVITAVRKVVEDLKIENDPKEFARIFRKYKGKIVVGCEATSNAFWVADVLEPLVEKVRVGHTSKIRWIAEARIKTDSIDAGILAELVRVDLFPSVGIQPRRIRDLRELVRGLVRIRRQATRCRNQVHSLLGRQGVAYQRADVGGSKLEEVVNGADLCGPARPAAGAYLRAEKVLKEEEKRLQGEMKKELAGEPKIQEQVARLATIPGVGCFSAALLRTIHRVWSEKKSYEEVYEKKALVG